jgi:hypothetical protein
MLDDVGRDEMAACPIGQTGGMDECQLPAFTQLGETTSLNM